MAKRNSKTAHKYEYDIDLGSDVAPARVLRMVGTGKKVLEIGAGPGSITRHLSGTLGCDVVALEIEPEALEKLKPFARSVYKLDLNDPTWHQKIQVLEGKFDVVIAADVLEHVYDPWTVLNGMKALLNDTGSVILSIPHVGHSAVAACLLDEDFQYGPWGLLDKTHIRFFGIKNVQALIQSQGLEIEQAEYVVRTPQMTEFAHRWARLPEDVRNALERNRYSHVYQVVTRSVPRERAVGKIDLMSVDVPAPEKKVASYWESVMSSFSPGSDSDLRSTMGDGLAVRVHSGRTPIGRFARRLFGS
ncbi:class I SAM-dependent methyltransferase [Aminobacter niigataensis]|uniref:class I SAM-dependent methyltransferase n=1 Tax=Aminobacter niigataensis TaxID=83265 RepID=UPI0024C76D12|nr:class I SAM-dependent methyltransferase [Aminobacter niigataensis]CAI2932535.1 protein of unknown function [Aminobacter niigataensis]